MSVSKGIENIIHHVVWCSECNSKLMDIQKHMIIKIKEECSNCKKATVKGMCKKHYEWVFPHE